jgi:hypothetical protein
VSKSTQPYYFDDVERTTFDGVVAVTATQRIYVRNDDISSLLGPTTFDLAHVHFRRGVAT